MFLWNANQSGPLQKKKKKTKSFGMYPKLINIDYKYVSKRI
jgi:hypothetical protein